MEIITKKWSIPCVDIVSTLNGRDNVITKLHWCCTASWENYNSTVSGEVDVPFDDTSYTEYQNLSEEFVLTWLFASMTKDEVIAAETAAKNQLIADVPGIPVSDSAPTTIIPHWVTIGEG